MKIKEIEILNVLGTVHAKFSPGTLTVISGQNGTGKSSIIDALLAVVAGGHDAGWLHKGAKSGVIVITLDDGTTIQKKITDKKSTLEILEPGNDTPIAAPQTYINQLAAALAVNPARLLACEPKEILAELLELCPMTFGRGEINAILDPLGNLTDADTDLAGVDKLRDELYSERKAHNKAARDAEGTVRDLQKSLPGGEDRDWGAVASKVEADLKAIEKAEKEELDSVKTQAQQARDEIKNGFTERERKLRDDFQASLTALNKERDEELEPIAGQEVEALDTIRAEYAPKKETVAAALATARERAKQQDQAAGQKKLIDQFNQKHRDANIVADHLTEAIDKLDALKKSKLDAMPVAGLEVKDGKVLVDGVEWEHVNTARQVSVAFELCAMRTGKLPFLLIDNAEHMDKETWAAFKEGALASGFQVVAARVSDGPLKIEALDS